MRPSNSLAATHRHWTLRGTLPWAVLALTLVLVGCASAPKAPPTAEPLPHAAPPTVQAEQPGATKKEAPAEPEPVELYTLPEASSAACAAYIERIVKAPNPLTEACISRYKSLEEEAVICRLDVVLFLRQNSKGDGESFDSCGQVDAGGKT